MKLIKYGVQSLFLLISLSVAGSSLAATYTVTNLSDSGAGSLRQALIDSNANPGADVIDFDPSVRGTIALTSGELIIGDDLTLNGPGANVVTVSGNNASRVFNVNVNTTPGVVVNINNITIADGYSNTAGSGAGLYSARPRNTLILDHLIVRDNRLTLPQTATNGAGVSVTGNLTVTNSVFAGNSAHSGAALSSGGFFGSYFTTVSNVVFSGNTASSKGGAVLQNGRAASYTNCTFYANSASESAGAMYNVNGGLVSLKNTVFNSNTAPTSPDVDDTFNPPYNTQSTSTESTSVTSIFTGTDPLFVNPASPAGADGLWLTDDDGLQIQAPSPAVDSGTDAGAPTTDILGKNRFGTTDIGAYEYVPLYTITALAGSNGLISPSGTVTVYSNTEQQFTITPAPNYSIADVLVDGVSVGAVSTYTFSNVTENHDISATFAIDTYTITASSGANGSVTPAGATSVNSGGSQAYAISPATGYHVADVLVDNVSVGPVTSYNFDGVTANHTISATFAINTHNIVATQNAKWDDFSSRNNERRQWRLAGVYDHAQCGLQRSIFDY